jgi:hypothetical protein
MSTSRPTFRRWLARLIVLGLAGALALLGAEVMTRLLWRQEAILFPRYHTGASYGPYQLRRLRPNTTFHHTSADGSWRFTTNAQGFRDTRDWHYERTPGVRRVLVLGDSHTQGFECRQEATFSALLAEKTGMEVLNCGVSGLGTAEQLAFLENEGLKYRPDVVVLAWFANDLDDNVKSGLFTVRDGALVAEKFAHQPGVAVLDALNRWAVLRWASEHSYFYSLLFNRVWDWRKARLSQQASAEYAIKAPVPEAAVETAQHTLAAKLVERMHAACRQAGAKFVIVDVPAFKAVDDFESSIPAPLRPVFRAHCDVLLASEEVLGAMRGQAPLFVAHGQHHISETTHAALAAALARVLP